jgi:hypothetical protein
MRRAGLWRISIPTLRSVQILLDLEAKRALGIHWGVFPLSDEGRERPREDPALALPRARSRPTASSLPSRDTAAI